MQTARSKPRKPRSRLEATAYHEAGHAVATYLRNRRFTSVSIVAERETLGQCVFGNKPGVIALDAESYRRTRDRIETLIIVALAGVLASACLPAVTTGGVRTPTFTTRRTTLHTSPAMSKN